MVRHTGGAHGSMLHLWHHRLSPRLPTWLGEEAKLVDYLDSNVAGDIHTHEHRRCCLLPRCWADQLTIDEAVDHCCLTEAKFVAATMVASQAIWLAWLLGDLRPLLLSTISIIVLLLSTISIIACGHERSKHIDVRYHFICECLENGSISTEFVSTKD